MKLHSCVVLASFLLIILAGPLMGETLRLNSGREVLVVDGKIPEMVAEQLYDEATGLLKEGRVELAGEYWQFIVEKATGSIVSRAKREQQRSREIEYGSFVLLRNNRLVKGKVAADLRTDLLGLEGKENIPVWQMEEIVAEYHPGYSRPSKTFYLFTILEIKLRGKKMKTSRIAREIGFTIEGMHGSVTKVLLGKSYQLLRPENLGEQIETLTADRIVKVMIYPDLRRLE